MRFTRIGVESIGFDSGFKKSLRRARHCSVRFVRVRGRRTVVVYSLYGRASRLYRAIADSTMAVREKDSAANSVSDLFFSFAYSRPPKDSQIRIIRMKETKKSRNFASYFFSGAALYTNASLVNDCTAEVRMAVRVTRPTSDKA